MKVLVSGDEYCYYCNGEYYLTNRGLLFSHRYLAVFEEVRFAFRCKHVVVSDLPKGIHKVENPKVDIAELPFFQGPAQMVKVLPKLLFAAKKSIVGIDCAILRLPSTSAFAVWRNVKAKHIPYETELVFDCNDAYNTSESILSKVIWKTMHILQQKACLSAVGVSCVTREYLQRHYPAAKGAVTEHYSTAELKPEFFYKQREYPYNNLMRIVHIATQVQYNGRKGHNELIKALSKVINNGYNAEIVFVGESYDDGIPKLKEYAKSLGLSDKVHFTGLLNASQLRDELIATNLAVLPTKAEGLPRVVIEAMATGLPCITTPVSGNPELIDSEWLVEYDDVESLSAKIIEFISSPAKYEQQSRVNFLRSKDYACEILNLRRNNFYFQLKSITISNASND